MRVCVCVCVCVCVRIHTNIYVYIVMKLLWLVYCRWRWQVFSLDPFTYAYRPDHAKRIADIRSDNILFGDVIQQQTNWENYDTEFLNKLKMKTTRNAQFRIQIYFIINPKI